MYFVIYQAIDIGQLPIKKTTVYIAVNKTDKLQYFC